MIDMEQHVSVGRPVAKTGFAVGGAGGAQALEASQQAQQAVQEVIKVFGLSLADWATIVAIGYTLCLWGEWAWRKFGRPFAEDRGWVKRLKRRHEDRDGDSC